MDTVVSAAASIPFTLQVSTAQFPILSCPEMARWVPAEKVPPFIGRRRLAAPPVCLVNS